MHRSLCPGPDPVAAWAHAEMRHINERRYERTRQIEVLIKQQHADNDAIGLIRRKLAARQGRPQPVRRLPGMLPYTSLPWEERLACAQRRWARLSGEERATETRQQRDATLAAIRWLGTNKVAA